jgi:Copper type II ascorbate-dependent monooxygenase, C-terminal domain
MHRILLASIFVIGCGGGGGTTDGNSGDDAPADATPISGEMHRLSYGPVTIQPGEEGTRCIWVRLSNATEIKVRQVHNQLSSSSHHLIVYKDDMDTTEQTTPVDCQPFTGALNTTGMIAPIVITQKPDDLLTLPDKVGYTLKPNQMVKIEMHYLNATDMPIDALATVDFYAVDPATIEHEANILFIGSPDIDIAPGETKTLHQFFTTPSYLDFSQSNVFAITGHTHKLGTNVSVRVAPGKTGPMTDVYSPTPFSWSEPLTKTHSPPFSIPKTGGFDFECTYTNTTTHQVGFGESATDEMCFFWAYYYPSQGSKVCVHTEQYGGANGINLCCPGDSLCSLVEQMF